MSAATWTTLAIAAAGFLTAATAVLRGLATNRQLQAHQAGHAVTNTPPVTGPDQHQ